MKSLEKNRLYISNFWKKVYSEIEMKLVFRVKVGCLLGSRSLFGMSQIGSDAKFGSRVKQRVNWYLVHAGCFEYVRMYLRIVGSLSQLNASSGIRSRVVEGCGKPPNRRSIFTRSKSGEGPFSEGPFQRIDNLAYN